MIVMMPVNHVLRTCTGGRKLTKSQERINHLLYMDDIIPFAKNEKELETLIQAMRIYNQGDRSGIRHRKMRYANNEKRETTHDGRNRTNKLRKIHNA